MKTPGVMIPKSHRMMKWRIEPSRISVSGVLIVLLLLGCTLGSARAETNLNLVFGVRLLDDEQFWQSADLQIATIGLEFNITRRSWPLRLEAALHYGERGGFLNFKNQGSDLKEFSVGAVGLWRGGRKVRPFIGGGWTFLRAAFFEPDPNCCDQEILPGVSESDTSSGVYMHGGVYWTRSREGKRSHLNLGLDFRRVQGTEVELFGVVTDADYNQLSFFVGKGWHGRPPASGP